MTGFSMVCALPSPFPPTTPSLPPSNQRVSTCPDAGITPLAPVLRAQCQKAHSIWAPAHPSVRTGKRDTVPIGASLLFSQHGEQDKTPQAYLYPQERRAQRGASVPLDPKSRDLSDSPAKKWESGRRCVSKESMTTRERERERAFGGQT